MKLGINSLTTRHFMKILSAIILDRAVIHLVARVALGVVAFATIKIPLIVISRFYLWEINTRLALYSKQHRESIPIPSVPVLLSCFNISLSLFIHVISMALFTPELSQLRDNLSSCVSRVKKKLHFFEKFQILHQFGNF